MPPRKRPTQRDRLKRDLDMIDAAAERAGATGVEKRAIQRWYLSECGRPIREERQERQELVVAAQATGNRAGRARGPLPARLGSSSGGGTMIRVLWHIALFVASGLTAWLLIAVALVYCGPVLTNRGDAVPYRAGGLAGP